MWVYAYVSVCIEDVYRKINLDLSNLLEHLLEPFLGNVEWLSSLDAFEFNCSDRGTFLVLVFSHATGNTRNGGGDTLLGAGSNEVTIEFIGGSGSGKVSRLLDKGLFGSNGFCQVLGKVLARVDLGKSYVSESIPRDFLSAGFHITNNFLQSGSLSEKDVQAAMFFHLLLQTNSLGNQVELELRNPNGVDIARRLAGGEKGTGKFELRQRLSVVVGSSGGQKSGITSHDFVQNKHAGVGGRFTDNVGEESSSLLCRSVGTESLFDGVDIIVDGLGHTDNGDLSSVLLQDVLGKFGGLGVGIVSSDSVNDINFVSDQSLGSDLERSFVVLDVTTLSAVLFVGQLDTRVSNGRSTDEVQLRHAFPVAFRDNEGISGQNSLVSINVHAEGKSGDFAGAVGLNPVFGKLTDAGTQAGSKTSRGHHSDGNIFSFEREVGHCKII
mmetsp:Transcript_24378/g.36997  ORF Transcript_24378/g.36997 Transcript_24378/m.36997 type:complete len:439 (+) Transcript_24378:42-1358(+)